MDQLIPVLNKLQDVINPVGTEAQVIGGSRGSRAQVSFPSFVLLCEFFEQLIVFSFYHTI